ATGLSSVGYGLSLHCCWLWSATHCHSSQSTDFGLVFACEVLHHVVQGVVLQERVSLRPCLIAADGSHQRCRAISERVTKILGHRNCVGVRSQRREKKVSANADVHGQRARREINQAGAPLPIIDKLARNYILDFVDQRGSFVVGGIESSLLPFKLKGLD